MLRLHNFLSHMLDRSNYVELFDVNTSTRVACGRACEVQYSKYRYDLVSYYDIEVVGETYDFRIYIDASNQVCDE